MARILRILNRFNLGGIAYNASYLTHYLSPEHETMLIGGSPSPGEAHSGFIPNELGIEYREIPEMSRAISPFNDLKAFQIIDHIIRDFKPNIVHTHAAKAGALGRIAAKKRGVPILVHTFHGHVFEGYFKPWKSKAVQFTERKLASISTAIVAISDLQKNDLVDRFHIAPSNKVHVIPLGFDLSRFTEDSSEKRKQFREKFKIAPQEIAIGIIGRLVPIKNHVLFLESIALLRLAGIPFKAIIIGDGETRSSLEVKAKELSLSIFEGQADYDLCFTSWISEINFALAGLDIVSMSSINEGTPVSLIEAQAAGLPVVSTRAGGVANCMVNNHSGYISEDFSSESFARHLLQLCENAALRYEMGQKGRQFALSHFSVERLASDTKALYSALLRNS